MKKLILLIAIVQLNLTANSQVLDWATKIGGATGKSIVVDDLGNSYIVGVYGGEKEFDLVNGGTIMESLGLRDVFIQKTDPNGNFVWAKSVGGTGDDIVYDIALDGLNNIYVIGQFSESADFDPGPSEANLLVEGVTDIFVLKLNNDGDYEWAFRIGNDNDYNLDEEAYGIDTDLSNNVYITGTFVETVDFNPGDGVSNLTAHSSTDIFVLKLSDNGHFNWAKRIGGVGHERAGGIVIDNDYNLYFTGRFSVSADFDPNDGVENHSAVEAQDVFVEKLDEFGNFIWVKTFGGTGFGYAYGIALDGDQNVYSTGVFQEEVDFDPSGGVDILTANDGRDMYVNKLDKNGNYQWTKSFGTTGDQYSTDIAADDLGGVYWLGYFTGTIDFDPSAAELNKTSISERDMFMHKMDADGNFEWMQLLGNEGYQQANSLFVVDNYEVYCTGSYQYSVDFDPTDEEFNLDVYGGFIQKLEIDNVSIETNNNLELINVYPNPSNGIFTIELPINKAAIVEIYSSTGKLVYHSTIKNIQNRIELNTIEKGIYYMSIAFDAENVIVKKLAIN